MKWKVLFIGVFALFFGSHNSAMANDYPDDRRLLWEIDSGIEQGLITRSEADYLYRQYDRYREYEERAWRNGRLNNREQRCLANMYQNLDRAIERQKRDGQRRGYGTRNNRNDRDGYRNNRDRGGRAGAECVYRR